MNFLTQDDGQKVRDSSNKQYNLSLIIQQVQAVNIIQQCHSLYRPYNRIISWSHKLAVLYMDAFEMSQLLKIITTQDKGKKLEPSSSMHYEERRTIQQILPIADITRNCFIQSSISSIHNGWSCSTLANGTSNCVYNPLNYIPPQDSGSVQCNDNNQIDGDGCSAEGNIQEGYMCITNFDGVSHCYIDCGRNMYGKYYQVSGQYMIDENYCYDYNSIDGDGCTKCKPDPDYVCIPRLYIYDTIISLYETYCRKCGNFKLDDNQICDYSLQQDLDCSGRPCQYQQAVTGSCGDLIVQPASGQVCDDYFACTGDCKDVLPKMSTDPSPTSVSGYTRQNRYIYYIRNNYYLKEKIGVDIRKFVNQYLLWSEQKNISFANLTMAELFDFYYVNGIYEVPGLNDIRQYDDVAAFMKLFLSIAHKRYPLYIKYNPNIPKQKEVIDKAIRGAIYLFGFFPIAQPYS